MVIMELLVDDVEEVICVAEGLICKYSTMKQRFKDDGMPEMVTSANGSIVGLVRLLTVITDKPASDWFEELEVWD